MICNRCGAENDDETRFCQACGHKLRSRDRPEPDSGRDAGGAEREDGGSPLFPSSPDGSGPAVWRKMAFAWTLALALGGVAVWAFVADMYWPLYPATLAAAVLAWRRNL